MTRHLKATYAVLFKPIGIIHSRHRDLKKIPIQPVFAWDCPGTVERRTTCPE